MTGKRLMYAELTLNFGNQKKEKLVLFCLDRFISIYNFIEKGILHETKILYPSGHNSKER